MLQLRLCDMVLSETLHGVLRSHGVWDMQDTLEKQTRKLDQLKAGNSVSVKNKSKKVDRLENQIKNTVQRELQSVKLKQAGLVSSQMWHVATLWASGVRQMCICLRGALLSAVASSCLAHH